MRNLSLVIFYSSGSESLGEFCSNKISENISDIAYNFIVRLLTQCHVPFSCLIPPAAFSVKAKRTAIIEKMCAYPQYDSQPSPFRFYHYVGFFP